MHIHCKDNLLLILGFEGFLVFDNHCFNTCVDKFKLPKMHELLLNLFIGVGDGYWGMFEILAFKIQNVISKDLWKGKH